MAWLTTASASVSDGPSSPARAHNSSIWDWRSATGQRLPVDVEGPGAAVTAS